MLHSQEHRLGGNGGCNQLFGSYTLKGDSLSFSGVGSTLMACPEPGMTNERRLAAVLERTTTWDVTGEELDLMREGKSIGHFRSVYLRH